MHLSHLVVCSTAILRVLLPVIFLLLLGNAGPARPSGETGAEAVAPLPATTPPATPLPATPLPATPLPDWVVLALQPVSGDRVRPVTGVVISSAGLLVVPLDFAAAGDQVIVLDGGADIIKNGRAAILRQQFPQLGLAVLSAPGLHRSPASLSSSPLQAGGTIHLAAFPPAEQISQGAAPLWVPAKVSFDQAAATPALQPAPRPAAATLPNVSGPLLDDCGNLVGFSSAEGVQSMETGKAPAYVWKDGLQAVLESMSLVLTENPCPAIQTAAVETVPAEAAIAQGTAAMDSPDSAIPDSGAEKEAARAGPQAATGLTAILPHWLYWAVTIGVLVIVVLAGLAFWLWRKSKTTGQTPSLLQDAPSALAGVRRLSPSTTAAEPAPTADRVLEISGRLPNGTPFTRRCKVSAAAINAVIGRGPVDLVIDSQGVHREHARLGGSADMMTITDLGSPQGTWINRVPCLKGEIMFIGPEDTIFLGDVSFQVTVQAAQG